MAKSISASVGAKGGINKFNDVVKIQELLNQVPAESGVSASLLIVDGICGPKTRDAIQKFQLKHFGWKGADGRVDPDGQTLAKLNEFDAPITQNAVCILIEPCAVDARLIPPPLPSDVQKKSFVPITLTATPSVAMATDASVMVAAFKQSRETLRLARNALTNLLIGFANENLKPLNDFQRRVLISVGRWMKAPTDKSNAGRASASSIIKSTIALIDGNLNVKTSSGGEVKFKRVSGRFHAQVFGNPDLGVECGEPFFLVDGPRCRRDVITHEFFHFMSVGHGGGANNGPTIRGLIKTPAQALNSADNLAQLISELMDGTRDACAIRGR